MTRRRRAAVVLAAAVAVGAVGTLATYDAFDLVALQPLDQPPLTWLVVWGLVVTAIVLYRPSKRQVLFGALPVAALVYLTAMGALFASTFADHDRAVLRTLRSPDHEVRLVEGTAFIDPIWEVRVRTRQGLLSRERTVWAATYPAAVSVRFTGPRSLAVTDETGTVYDVTF